MAPKSKHAAKPKARAPKKAASKAMTLVGEHDATQQARDLAIRERYFDSKRTDADKIARILQEHFSDFSPLDRTTLCIDNLSLETRLLRDMIHARESGHKLTKAYFVNIRRQYLAKKNGAAFLQVTDKSEPIDSVFGAALAVLTSVKYLTKRSMAPMLSFFITGKPMNQRSFVWMLKAMLDVKPSSPGGSQLLVKMMDFIGRTNMQAKYNDELEGVRVYMDEALVKEYSLVKGHVGLSAFVATHKRSLGLLLDVDELRKVLEANASSDWEAVTTPVMNLLKTNIGNAMVGFLHGRVVASAFEKFVKERLEKHGDKRISAAWVEETTIQCMGDLHRLGYEELCKSIRRNS